MNLTDCPFSGEELEEYRRWYEERPEKIRELIDRRPPWVDYYWKDSDGPPVYQIVSYDETKSGVALTVFTEGSAPPISSRHVFGVSPETLTPAEKL